MNLMKANKDPEIKIKDTDRFFYHVEHTRILADPTGKYPETNIRIQVYSKKDYNDLFGKGGFISKHGLGAMSDDKVRVVHDPILEQEIEDKGAAEAQKAMLAAEKAEKEAEVKAKEDEKADAEKKEKEAQEEVVRKAEEKELAEKKAAEKAKADEEEMKNGIKEARIKKAAETRARKKAEKEADEEAARRETSS